MRFLKCPFIVVPEKLNNVKDNFVTFLQFHVQIKIILNILMKMEILHWMNMLNIFQKFAMMTKNIKIQLLPFFHFIKGLFINLIIFRNEAYVNFNSV